MIDVKDLLKLFPHPDGREIRAVNGLTFHVRPGEIYGLIGPNGAGKTTTLRILSGLIRPSGGRAILNGCDVVKNPSGVKRSIAFMTSNTGLYQRLTPRELLTYFAELHGLNRRQSRRRVEELVDLVGLREFADQRCGGLSTGQRQRTSIARALVADPPVLIMDEPTVGLDVLTNRVIVDFIGRQGRQGKAVLLSTHHLDEAEALCTRIGLIHEGRLVAEGTFPELCRTTGCRRLTDVFLSLIDAGSVV